MKCLIYTRVSTAKEDDKQTTANQVFALKQYAEQRGWEVYAIYEEDVSGTGKKERPQFQKMLELAQRRWIDIVLVWNYDRFSRAGYSDMMKIFEMKKNYGVSWVSLQEPFLNTETEMGELLLPIYAWIAKREAAKISERTKAALARIKVEGSKSGKPIGRPRKSMDWAAIEADLAAGMGKLALCAKYKISFPFLHEQLKKRAGNSSEVKEEPIVPLNQTGG